MTTFIRTQRINQGGINLPLRVVPRATVTFHITDATGVELGASTDEKEAYQIRDQVQNTLAPKEGTI